MDFSLVLEPLVPAGEKVGGAMLERADVLLQVRKDMSPVCENNRVRPRSKKAYKKELVESDALD